MINVRRQAMVARGLFEKRKFSFVDECGNIKYVVYFVKQVLRLL